MSEYGRYADRQEASDAYRECLDEVYGLVSVAGFEYSTSRALELLDPTAFWTGFNDWLDEEVTEYQEEGSYDSGLFPCGCCDCCGCTCEADDYTANYEPDDEGY